MKSRRQCIPRAFFCVFVHDWMRTMIDVVSVFYSSFVRRHNKYEEENCSEVDSIDFILYPQNGRLKCNENW